MEKITNHQQVDHPEHPPDVPGKGQVVKIERQVSQFSGPLPAPEILQRYETILPGSAERILAMAEMHARHGAAMDTKALEAQIAIEKDNVTTARRGQNFAMLSTLVMAAVSFFALYSGYPAVAGTICSITIVGLASVFVIGKVVHKDD